MIADALGVSSKVQNMKRETYQTTQSIYLLNKQVDIDFNLSTFGSGPLPQIAEFTINLKVIICIFIYTLS